MITYIKFILLLVLFPAVLNCQWFQEGIDTVFSFRPGIGQNSGQEPEYYPKNIFGLPDTSASETFQASSPYEILSLGLGGEIIVGFKDYIISDGPGPDFTVFENPFLNPATNKIFAEPGKISVSQDGIHFIDFPFDSVTLKGCAGVTPTNGKSNPFDPSVSGGDKFDISSLKLKWIKYIRITDICRMLLDNPKLPYYDPMISGFDLDAVIGLHLIKEKQTEDVNENQNVEITISESTNYIIIKSLNRVTSAFVSDLKGNIIYKLNDYENLTFDKGTLPHGVFFLIINTISSKKVYKFIN